MEWTEFNTKNINAIDKWSAVESKTKLEARTKTQLKLKRDSFINWKKKKTKPKTAKREKRKENAQCSKTLKEKTKNEGREGFKSELGF